MTQVSVVGSVVPKGITKIAGGRWPDLVRAAIVFAVIAVLPLLVRDVYLQNVLILTLLYAAVSQSWNILGGYCGQISLGHGLYFGIGAYATTALYVLFGISPWLGLVAGGGLAALLAVGLGYPCFRLKGHYYSIATIVIAEIGLVLVHNWDFVGGAMGLQWPVDRDGWATLQFGRDKVPSIYLALALFVMVWVVTFAIERSRWGYWWRAVKDNAEAARSLGVDVFRSKIAAAAVSAGFTAVGGGFYAAFVGYIDPDSVMSFRFSLLFALPAVLGGIGTLWGPALGAAILIPLTEILRSYAGGSGSGLDLIVYGGLVTVVALARPDGLLSLIERAPAGRRAA
ncbi:branched-chain amino acid ABC transporter permease [Bradyrhizobium sp. U87765 SZCCT0131]|uniref:branched-chain amino acid ABC transporter permease n=1 Tax=unclassified Bradyrhizobium TaxID=2631580 RepID=UPI001BA91264|nr:MULTISPECIES: branched-chain amino acid ABC transporter permease [unclassified Bradyrhizobium]MBR1221549.1 branched-chain amino acid ABC transporter permease [Bradyrhizobium sp. U87765 SZCCT0131]MBR1264528.1 branched-chain amino acid ABC transporter permease [Bradyrhizobium sp. U87765 SZCCT0134]MBR1304565.1 branched-chain amino acid ABC transporter permease [Bradyrhizobium sp. U87765 SZCCT0110]MBR1322578.1 branched-chain amino acid ABC transporter permease [Bradyrhizobium sp. U87765 SZCCT010